MVPEYFIVALVIQFTIAVVGMLFAYYLGSRKESETVFPTNEKLEPEIMEESQEATDEEYMKHIKAWTQNDGETESDK